MDTEEEKECVELSVQYECSYHKIMLQKFNLSPCELKILDLIILGKSTNEIAEYYKVTDKAIKFHLGNLYKKTSAKGRVKLITLVYNMCGYYILPRLTKQ